MLMPLSPVYASESTTSGSTESAASENVVLPQLYQLNYADIEKVIAERNPTVKTNMDLIDSADNGYLAINDAKGDISSSVGSLTQMIKALRVKENADGTTPEQKATYEVQIRGYQAQIASLGNSIATLENNAEDAEQSVAKAKTNVEMVNQQIFSSTQSLFFANDALGIQRKGLEDNISYLTKKNEAINLQKALGMVSALDVSTFDQQIKDLNYQIDMVKQQQDTVRGQVNLLVGQDFNHPLDLIGNYSFDEANASTQDYPKDLQTAMEKSYALKLQQMDIDAKQLALDHSEEMDGIDTYAYKKAQADLDAAKTTLDDVNKKLKQQFDQAYNDVHDKLEASKLEQSRLDVEKTKLSNAQLSNKVGTLSNLDLEGVTVEYNGQVLKAQNAQEDLLKAYTVYQWLLKGVGPASQG
jgi:hypothetical protein